MVVVGLATAMMIVRGAYRSVELVQGWTGYLISRQGYLIGFDAGTMVVAMGCLAVWNPARLFAAACAGADGLIVEELEDGKTDRPAAAPADGGAGSSSWKDRAFVGFLERVKARDVDLESSAKGREEVDSESL